MASIPRPSAIHLSVIPRREPEPSVNYGYAAGAPVAARDADADPKPNPAIQMQCGYGVCRPPPETDPYGEEILANPAATANCAERPASYSFPAIEPIQVRDRWSANGTCRVATFQVR